MGPAAVDRERSDVLRTADGAGCDVTVGVCSRVDACASVDDRDVHVSPWQSDAHSIQHARTVLLWDTRRTADGIGTVFRIVLREWNLWRAHVIRIRALCTYYRRIRGCLWRHARIRAVLAARPNPHLGVNSSRGTLVGRYFDSHRSIRRTHGRRW